MDNYSLQKPLNMAPTGIATFAKSDLATDIYHLNADVAVLGAPFDLAIQGRTGCRLGPRGIRLGSTRFTYKKGGTYDSERKQYYMDARRWHVVDCGDVDYIPGDLKGTMANLESAVSIIQKQGALPVVLGGDNSLFEPGLLLKCLYFFRIPFVIYRISTDQILIPFLKSSLIDHHLDSAICMYTEISSAFRTDIISLFYILCDDGSSALVTFTKKSFRYLRPGSTDRTMALYSGNNSCLFEHVIQLHDRSLLLIPKLYVTVHSVYSNTLFICFHSFDEFYICIS